jgi:hypothetical protein
LKPGALAVMAQALAYAIDANTGWDPAEACTIMYQYALNQDANIQFVRQVYIDV